MRRRVSRIFLSLLLLSSVWGGVVVRALTQRGGFYLLSRAEDLAQFARMVNEGGDTLCARLTDDIDFRAYPTTMIGIKEDAPFRGTFDGQGHTVTLALESQWTGDYSGALFRCVRDASFCNLVVRGSVTTRGKHAAGLVCHAEGVCSFTNVLSDVDISSDAFDDCIGGILGIAGENISPHMADITFTNCAFTGSVRYLGQNVDKIHMGTHQHHGGLIVGWKGNWNTRIYLINCYAAPRSIHRSIYFNTFVRYWVGKDAGLIFVKNCYYSSAISDYGQGIAYNKNQGEAKTPEEFADGSVCALLNNGNVQYPIWTQQVGTDSLPRPTCNKFRMTDWATVEIGTEDELEHFAQAVNAGNVQKNAVLTADIDYRGHREMIGATAPYEGLFDGACHKITIDFNTDKDNPALFQQLGPGGMVRNLHVDGSLTTYRPCAAGIVSRLDGGFVGNCLSTVNIVSRYEGRDDIGGIASRTDGNSVITNCIYSGRIESPRPACASVVGWVGTPGVLIRNSLFLNETEADSTGATGYPLFRGNPNWVTIENSFSVNNPGTMHGSIARVSMSSLQSAELFYSIWGHEIFAAEKKIEHKERQIKRANFYWGLISVTLLFLIFIAVQYGYYNKTLQQKYALLYKNAVKEHQIWLSQQAQAMQQVLPNDQPTNTPNNQTANTAEPAENTRQKLLYTRLLQIMEEKQLYTNPDLDKQTVVRELGTNDHYLSDCISQLSDYPNFNAWLASYRINHALQLIEEDPTLNVESLYLLSGFANHTTFTRHFRNNVGMTCKQYLMMRRNSVQNRK